MALYSPCHLPPWSWSEQPRYSHLDSVIDDEEDTAPIVKQESIDPSCHFIMESFPTHPPPSQPIPTKVPLRTQGPVEMRNLMSIIRTDPFEMHPTGERRRAKSKNTCAEARPHSSEPLMFEFQLELTVPILDQRDELPPQQLNLGDHGLRAFSPDFDIQDLQLDLGLESDSSQEEHFYPDWKPYHPVDTATATNHTHTHSNFVSQNGLFQYPASDDYVFASQHHHHTSRHGTDSDPLFSQRSNNSMSHHYYQKPALEDSDYFDTKIHRSQYHQSCRNMADETRISAPRPWNPNVYSSGYHENGLMGVASSRSTPTDLSISIAPIRRWSLPESQVQHTPVPIGFLM